MKNLARILSVLVLAAVALFFSACGGDGGDEPDPAAQQIELLVGTWKIASPAPAGSVTYNGDEYSSDYAGFTIVIASSSNNTMTYTVTGRPAETLSPWNANGTFTFGADVKTQLKRGDGVDLSYTVSGNSLQLTLTGYPSDKGYPTRVESVEGDWVFKLTK
jgi:hypothetical protein